MTSTPSNNLMDCNLTKLECEKQGYCSGHELPPVASNNLKEQVAEMLMKDDGPSIFVLEDYYPAASQAINLILDTILASKEMQYETSKEERDMKWVGRPDAQRDAFRADLRTMIMELKK